MKVRQLVWKGHDRNMVADFAFGSYRVENVHDEVKLGKNFHATSFKTEYYLTIDKAKAAAQADFEARVKACLEPCGPLPAYAPARCFLQSFDGQTFGDEVSTPFDRQHLGVALDYIDQLTAECPE